MEAGASGEETEHALSAKSSNLLRLFGGFSADELTDAAGGGDSDDIELELSLGGCFSSVDSRKRQILRSSSIPAVLPSELQPVVPLSRRCSLPSETEEDMWRRKEMQSMKRLEAKRKMEERRMGVERSEQGLEGGSVAKFRRTVVENGGSWILGGGPANRSFSAVQSRWIAGAPPPSVIPLMSQGSILSQASSSSAGSELESRPGGPGQGFELSGFNHASMAEHKRHKASSVSPSSSATPASKPINGSAIRSAGNGPATTETPLRKNGGRCSNDRSMEEMPSVSTRGEGPNGRRVEGFLYKYRRGEEVRIVCVCHGSFLTPAEFVKHGGGGDVAHPLKHIVVNPSPAFL